MLFQKIRVRTWFLRYSEDRPRVVPSIQSGFELKAWKPGHEEYSEVYQAVGSTWGWAGRLIQSKHELDILLANERNLLWSIGIEGHVMGFVELDARTAGSNEITYLGVSASLTGKGLGRVLLHTAISEAFTINPGKVWLHTCALDHPEALRFYQNEGFIIYESRMLEDYYPAEFLSKHGLREGDSVEEGFIFHP